MRLTTPQRVGVGGELKALSIFTVYEPPADTRSKTDRAEDLVFVRDEFSRPTLVFGPLWLLLKRQWTTALLYLAVATVGAAILAAIGLPSALWGYFYLGLNLIFALEAPLIRGQILESQGWHFVGASEGRNEEDATYRFLHAWLTTSDLGAETSIADASKQISLTKPVTGAVSPMLRDARPPRILN